MKTLFVFLLALLAANCTHQPKPWKAYPVSVGSLASLCSPGRKVYCEWADPECGAVQLAVQAVNTVVPGLLVYAGEMPTEGLKKVFSEQQVIVVLRGINVPVDYSKLPIASTLLHADEATACIESTPIVLIWPHSALSPADWQQTVLHELLHGLGAGHADEKTAYSTIMRPALKAEHRIDLSTADKNWLRTVYGQD